MHYFLNNFFNVLHGKDKKEMWDSHAASYLALEQFPVTVLFVVMVMT